MEWLLTGRGAPSIGETIEAAEKYFGEEFSGKTRETARRALEKRELAFQPDKVLRKLATTEDRLIAAEKEIKRLEAKLAAARKALE